MSSERIPLQRIDQFKSIRETVTDNLRTAIILGDLEEGRVYSAPALAEAMGVSATPVREAMMDLMREDLVWTVKNKGFRISEMTAEDLEEQTQVRQLLEAPAMQAIAGRIPEADYPDLRELADQIATGAARNDLHLYLRADREFHARLIQYSGNRRLEQLTIQLRSQTRMKALRQLAGKGLLVESAAEHHELLNLIESGDGEGAFELTVKHLGHASTLWSTGDENTRQRAALVTLFPQFKED